MSCNASSDCLANGTVRFCYEEASFSDESFFCDCSNWYGWVGENCDQVSPPLRYLRATALIIIFWGSIVVAITSRTLFYHISARISLGTPLNPAFYTGFFVWLSSLLLASNAALQTQGAFDHTKFEIVKYNELSGSFEDLTVKHGRVGVYFQMFASVSIILSSVLIVQSWSDVIEATSKIIPNLFLIREDLLRKIVKGYFVVFFLLLLISLSLDLILAWSLMISISSWVITLTYLIGYRRFVTTLRKLSATDEAGKAAIRNVQLAAQVNTISYTIVSIIFLVFYYLYLDYEESLELGKFNYVLFLRDLATFVSLFLNCFNAWYLHNVTRKILKLGRTNTCIPTVRLTKMRTRSSTTEPDEGDTSKEKSQPLKPSPLGTNMSHRKDSF